MRRLDFRLLVLLLVIVALTANCQATIDYHVSIQKEAIGAAIHVQMIVPTGTGRIVLKSPVWQPGAYSEADFGKSIQQFKALNSDGSNASFQHPNFSTWVIEGNRGDLVVRYNVPIGISHQVVHFEGPSTFLYVDGRQQESCHLTIEVPVGWKLAEELDPYQNIPGEFLAPSYDVLADAPVTMGKFLEDHYISHGKPHEIVLYGAGAKSVNQKFLIQCCKFVSDAEGNFFGETPYKRYVWHFDVFKGRGGGGGLEHLNSTEITMPSTIGASAQGILMHEFFHLWNVKRIRSKVLGPFDYSRLPRTGALWWLEGVTDYYAHTLQARYGWSSKDRLLKTIAANIVATESNKYRFQVSPYDSSFRVRDADHGHGNSNGYKVSYYNTGWLLGLLLDVDIRTHSHGKNSLDSVEMALWRLCRNNQPGFPESEIRNLCQKEGGSQVAHDFDQWVMKPGDLPYQSALDQLGLVGKNVTIQEFSLPFQTAERYQGGALQYLISDPGSTTLQIGDQLISVNGESAEKLENLSSSDIQALAKAQPKLEISVIRNGKAIKTTADWSVFAKSVFEVTENPQATSAQLRLQRAWLSPRPGTKAVYSHPQVP